MICVFNLPLCSLQAAYAHLCLHHHAPSHPGNLSPTHIPSHLSSHGLPKLPTFPSTYPLTPAASNHASTHSPNSLLTHPLSLSLPTHMPIHSYSYLPGHSRPPPHPFIILPPPRHLPILQSLHLGPGPAPERALVSLETTDSPHTTAEGAALFPRGVNVMT